MPPHADPIVSPRPYHEIAVASRPYVTDAAARERVMREVIDALWASTSPRGVSWIGFYLKVPGKDEMVLGPSRNKPACSPIGLHGMCGRCFLEKKPILIADVRSLGANYIACDPKDMSEAVVPLIAPDGSCDAVLDADSYDVGAFTQHDIDHMGAILLRTGLSAVIAGPTLRL